MVDSPEGTCLTTGASKGEVEIGVFAYRLLIGRVEELVAYHHQKFCFSTRTSKGTAPTYWICEQRGFSPWRTKTGGG